MPRLARKYLNTCFYHVITQGINREYIFKGDKLKEVYKGLIKKNLKNANVEILAYCIMGNHAHMLIYTEKVENVTTFMRKINTSYGMFYNKINNRVGYVFRDRYYTQTIKNQKQLFNCIVYIHNNPLKANLVKERGKYKYSSYIEYLGKKDLLTSDGIKLVFGSAKNYEDTFNIIHRNNNISDIIDIEEREESSKIIEEYLCKFGQILEDIMKDEEKFCELLLDLRYKGGKSLREMSKIFGVNKDKLNKIINKKL